MIYQVYFPSISNINLTHQPSLQHPNPIKSTLSSDGRLLRCTLNFKAAQTTQGEDGGVHEDARHRHLPQHPLQTTPRCDQCPQQ